MNEADTLISKLLSEVEKLNKRGHTIIWVR
jgi:hypothetical protein